ERLAAPVRRPGVHGIELRPAHRNQPRVAGRDVRERLGLLECLTRPHRILQTRVDAAQAGPGECEIVIRTEGLVERTRGFQPHVRMQIRDALVVVRLRVRRRRTGRVTDPTRTVAKRERPIQNLRRDTARDSRAMIVVRLRAQGRGQDESQNGGGCDKTHRWRSISVPAQGEPQSPTSAVTGLTFAARRAGIDTATNETIASSDATVPITIGLTASTPKSCASMKRAVASDPRKPASRPMPTIFTPSPSTRPNTARTELPSAMRMPISRRRCATWYARTP